MALWDFSCVECKHVDEYNGSMFNPPPCNKCGALGQVIAGRESKVHSRLFPFEGRHITPDGKPIVIESIHHLRQVEKKFGVVLSAFSKSNIRDVDPIKSDLPKYRGGRRD